MRNLHGCKRGIASCPPRDLGEIMNAVGAWWLLRIETRSRSRNEVLHSCSALRPDFRMSDADVGELNDFGREKFSEHARADPGGLSIHELLQALESKTREFQAWRYDLYAEEIYRDFKDIVPQNGKVFEIGAAWWQIAGALARLTWLRGWRTGAAQGDGRKELRRRWHRVAIVVLPGLILSPLWVVAVSAEIAAWRLKLEEHHPPEHFDPLWKLQYMWEHPLHFPLATWRAISGWGDRLWQELIGILGWQDVLLRPWTYVVLTVLLMRVPLQKLQLDAAVRARVAVMTGLTVLGYVVLIYLIFFLTYTPLDIDHVRGVQGRYFVITLPAVAIFVAAALNLKLPDGMSALIATVGALISGIATVAALFRAHW